jgi:hypothetical protein
MEVMQVAAKALRIGFGFVLLIVWALLLLTGVSLVLFS